MCHIIIRIRNLAIYKGAYWYVSVVSEIINGVDFVQFFFVSHTNQCCFLICLHSLCQANCPANFATLTHIPYQMFEIKEIDYSKIVKRVFREYSNIQMVISSIKYVIICFLSKFSQKKNNLLYLIIVHEIVYVVLRFVCYLLY